MAFRVLVCGVGDKDCRILKRVCKVLYKGCQQFLSRLYRVFPRGLLALWGLIGFTTGLTGGCRASFTFLQSFEKGQIRQEALEVCLGFRQVPEVIAITQLVGCFG